MPKYELLREEVKKSNLVPSDNLIASQPASDEQILRVHSKDYLHRLIAGEMTDREMRRIGFPWSEDLVARARLSVGGTISACRSALKRGISVNLAGGTHHAHPEHGEGFCVFNDVAIAARAMQAEGVARRILVIDLDVHQGDGTAAIFATDDSVFTFSVHGEKNFPYRKVPSDMDIALPDACGDDEYLLAVRDGLEQALDSANADLAIFIAGADPYQGDRLGRLSVTKAGLATRDRIVFETCQQLGIPVATVLGGGYANPVEDTIAIHLQTIGIAVDLLPVMN
ncbi:MAG TPA: histone deacetylase [Anaerolineales bacterium]|nr:histone deacetylase [Anaerolineales bacterium]